MSLAGSRILLGVTGSIASYKTPHLVRLLVKAGAQVQVVATPSALAFVSHLSLATVSGRPVYSQFLKDENGSWVNHVELAQWADFILVAPATLNTVGKWAYSQCDNLLMSVLFSAKSPCFIAPAMDLDMYQHPAFTQALQLLHERGVTIIPAEDGPLASGLSGQGRMAEPEHIVAALEKEWPGIAQSSWTGKTILLTSGSTREYIDPVRFLSNASSGKMGVALAENLAVQGAHVVFIYGKGSQTPREGFQSHIKAIEVETAQDMLNACLANFTSCNGAILAAAVTDFKAAVPSATKLKKMGADTHLALTENPDIAAHLGQIKQPHQFLCGFALETENGKENALAKMSKKNLDWIVLNDAGQPDGGIGSDFNAVEIFSSKGLAPVNHPNALKTEIARFIIDTLASS